MRNGGNKSADGDGHTGGEVAQPFCQRQINIAAVENPHAQHRNKSDNETVKSLRAGDDLQNHDLTEFARILAQKTGAGLAGYACALRAARAGKADRKTRAEHPDGGSGSQFKNTHNSFLLYVYSISTYLV